jgi:glutathione S-transferase
MRLYWHPFSIFPRRVRIALLEKGVPCEDVIVDLPGGALNTPEFRRLNPFGQVPVLEDDGLGPLRVGRDPRVPGGAPPDAAAHARRRPAARDDPAMDARRRRLLIGPFHRWLARFFNPDSVDHADVERARDDIARHLDVLERVLDGREHLAGSFSLADVCYAPFACELETAQLGRSWRSGRVCRRGRSA